MDISYTDYSNDGEVNRCLNTLEIYLLENQSVTPEITKKALETLEYFLGDENKFSQLNYSTLGHINATLKDYQKNILPKLKQAGHLEIFLGKEAKGQKFWCSKRAKKTLSSS